MTYTIREYQTAMQYNQFIKTVIGGFFTSGSVKK